MRSPGVRTSAVRRHRRSQVGEPGEQRAERDPALQPGQRRAEAVVDAVAEGEVAAVGAGHVQPLAAR